MSFEMNQRPRSWRARANVIASLLVVSCVAGQAHSDEPSTEGVGASKAVVWQTQWRRVGPVEYVATPTLFGSAFAIQYLIRPEDEADWNRAALFDSALRDSMRVESRSGRDRAAGISDIAVATSLVYPFAVDAGLVSWGIHGRGDVAWQLAVIDAQAFGTTTLLSALAKRAFARLRPYGTDCDGVAGEQDLCESDDRFRSFFSGHAGIAATSAGLTCAHHANLELYGGGASDAAACAGSIGLSLATGALRIASDRHWATDVAAGSVLGFATGYLMPSLLYYRPAPASDSAWRWALVPDGSNTSLGVRWVGVF